MNTPAVKARERRKNEREVKLFNDTLKEYVSTKYDSIFDEYSSFYSSLKSKHPTAKSLLKTSTFKRWKRSVIKQSFQEEVDSNQTESSVETSEVNEDELRVEASEANNNLVSEDDDLTSEASEGESCVETSEANNNLTSKVNEGEDDIPVHGDDNVSDILSTVIEETLVNHNIVDITEFENVDNIIEDIITDLERNETVREILEPFIDMIQPENNDDEGIALDYQTELDAILEPFDYELEVEGFDW